MQQCLSGIRAGVGAQQDCGFAGIENEFIWT
jgi:hypothetical protein